MKILQLCMRVPFPANDGATIAMYRIAQSLIENGAPVKILALNTNKNFIPPGEMKGPFYETTRMESVFIELSVKPFDAFLNIFSDKSYNIIRFFSGEFDKKLKAVLQSESFDIVQIEGLHLTVYLNTIRSNSSARIVLRAHNAEYIIWKRMADLCSSFLKKKYLKLLASRLKNYETVILNKMDAIIPITEDDKQIFVNLGSRTAMKVLPVGINASEYPPDESSNREFIAFHLGSMNWMPNLEAVDWFLSEVFDKIIAGDPSIKILLAGKDMPERIKNLAGDCLIVMDRIDNAKEFMKDKSVMMVPLLSGSGMRVKIIEGMAAGKAIVSTSIGAEGIKYTHGENILIADTAEDFAKAILKLKNDVSLRIRLGAEAKKLVWKHYDNKQLGSELKKFYEELLK